MYLFASWRDADSLANLTDDLEAEASKFGLTVDTIVQGLQQIGDAIRDVYTKRKVANDEHERKKFDKRRLRAERKQERLNLSLECSGLTGEEETIARIMVALRSSNMEDQLEVMRRHDLFLKQDAIDTRSIPVRAA